MAGKFAGRSLAGQSMGSGDDESEKEETWKQSRRGEGGSQGESQKRNDARDDGASVPAPAFPD